jgi:hypothetical protein
MNAHPAKSRQVRLLESQFHAPLNDGLRDLRNKTWPHGIHLNENMQHPPPCQAAAIAAMFILMKIKRNSEPPRPFRLEEPTHPDNVFGHQTIVSAIAPLRVAAGEHVPNRVVFKIWPTGGA